MTAADLVILAKAPLDGAATTTATWVARITNDRAAIFERFHLDVPATVVHQPQYLLDRCQAELDRPIGGDANTASVMDGILSDSAIAETVVRGFADVPRLAQRALTQGVPAGLSVGAFVDEGVVAVRFLVVPIRWPQGALLIRDRFLSDTEYWMLEVEKRAAVPCVAGVVLTWFLEEGVPTEPEGLAADLVVTSFPTRRATTKQMPTIMHRQLLSDAMLEKLRRG